MYFKEQHFDPSDLPISAIAINGKIAIKFNGLGLSS